MKKESSLAAALRKFQNIEIETTLMTTQALDTSCKSKSKLISMLGNDLKKNMVHIKDIIGILTDLVGKKKTLNQRNIYQTCWSPWTPSNSNTKRTRATGLSSGLKTFRARTMRATPAKSGRWNEAPMFYDVHNM